MNPNDQYFQQQCAAMQGQGNQGIGYFGGQHNPPLCLSPGDHKLITPLIEILSHQCGATGESESAVETLARIVRERDQYKEAEIAANHRVMCLADQVGILNHELAEEKKKSKKR